MKTSNRIGKINQLQLWGLGFASKIGVILLSAILVGCSTSPFSELPQDPEVCLVSIPDGDPESPQRFTEIELLEQYYGVDEETTGTGKTDERLLYSGEQLKAILEDKDFTVFSFSGSLREETTGIIENLDAGRPLLILLDSKTEGTFWVFLVGYGKDGEYLVVQRPDRSLKALITEQILPWWDINEQLTLLAVPSHLVGE